MGATFSSGSHPNIHKYIGVNMVDNKFELSLDDREVIADALELYGSLIEKMSQNYVLSYKVLKLIDYIKYRKV